METAAESIKNDDGPPKKKAKMPIEKDSNKRDLSTLPYEILTKIFSYLDLKSIINCATLCTTLNDVSKDGSLYKKVSLKYTMSNNFMESYISKINFPKHLYIEYKFFCKQSIEEEDAEDYTQFNKHVQTLLRKCGESLLSLKIESCRTDDVLLLLSECTNLKSICLYRCKGTFVTLPSLTNLISINFVQCHFPSKLINEVIKNNEKLRKIHTMDNTNINVNEVLEIMALHNHDVRDINFGEGNKLKADSIRALARLNKLKHLELITGRSGFRCEPEDSLEQVAAGCRDLQSLTIYGWREINDDNFLPIVHNCTQLRKLDLRGVNITIKTAREAALSLPLLKDLDVIKNRRIRKAELAKLKQEFREIDISLYS